MRWRRPLAWRPFLPRDERGKEKIWEKKKLFSFPELSVTGTRLVTTQRLATILCFRMPLSLLLSLPSPLSSLVYWHQLVLFLLFFLANTTLWRNVTFVGLPCIIGLAGYIFSQGHHHPEEQPAYSYLNIRNKEFPWGKQHQPSSFFFILVLWSSR